MGTKFTTKFLYVQSGDRVKKLILQFKEDQGDRYKCYWIRYIWHFSIYFFQPVKFFTIYFYSIFSWFVVYLRVLADCR